VPIIQAPLSNTLGVSRKTILVAIAATFLIAFQSLTAQAAISYTMPGGTYSQNFDGLPVDARNNSTIESGAISPLVNYTDGWQDDVDPAVSTEVDVSIPGWYLYHPLQPAGTTPENGFNNHQRLRFGPGNDNAGSFYGFASDPDGAGTMTAASNPEKALGFLPSTTLATNPVNDPSSSNDDTMFIGLRLTNNTGQALDAFTLKYDGEQWRDGGRSGANTSVLFSWRIDPVNIHQIAGFANVPELGFTSVVANNSATAAAVDGNTAGKVAVAPFTVTGVNWAPGTDLWLRWGDQQLTGSDHGMAIDNVVFSANISGPPAGVPGDYNANGVVDAADYVLWRDNNGLTSGATTAQGDGTGDGMVNSDDFDFWQARFGNTSGSGSGLDSAAVPEPTSLALVALLAGLVHSFRKR
jgi:hypothetical protein